MKKKGEGKRLLTMAVVVTMAVATVAGSLDISALAAEKEPGILSEVENGILGAFSNQNVSDNSGEQGEQQESVAETEDVTVETEEAVEEAENSYNFQVGDVTVCANNAADVFGDGTVSYDETTNTLTLKNANITGGLMEEGGVAYYVGIARLDAGLNIVLEGENTVSVAGGVENYGIAAIDLSISGSGSLFIQATGATERIYGLYAASGLTISDSVSVDVNSGAAPAVSAGIGTAQGDIIISDTATVRTRVGVAEGSIAILALGSLKVTDSAKVEAICSSDTESGWSMAIGGDIVFEQAELVKTTGVMMLYGEQQIQGTLNGLVAKQCYDENDDGYLECTVYGDAEISNFPLYKGCTLTIPEGTTLTINGRLTIEEGVTVINNGTVQLGEGGLIDNKAVGSDNPGGFTCSENAVHPVDENYKCLICGKVCEHPTVNCMINDNTDAIVAKCISCQSVVSSWPVTVKGGTYNGKTYGLSFGTPTGILAKETPVVTYCCSGGCKNAGEHTADMKINNQTVTVKFTITKAKAEGRTLTKGYLYSGKQADSINLPELLPTDCGKVTYGQPVVTGKVTYEKAPAVSDGKLTYTIKPGKVNDTGMITLDVVTENYENIKVTVNLKLEKTAPDESQLPAGTQSTLTDAQKQITKANTDKKDVADSVFTKLQLKATGKNKAVKLTWKKVKNADGYIIYGAQCGKSLKKIKTIKKASTVSYTHKKLKKAKYYKYVIVAYKKVDGKNYVISTSKSVHAVTNGGKYGNPTKVSVKASQISVKKGGKKTIKATLKLPAGKKNKVHIAKFRYESSNTKVATVTSKGVVKGKKKGTAYIYVYAQNGVYKRVKVTVK